MLKDFYLQSLNAINIRMTGSSLSVERFLLRNTFISGSGLIPGGGYTNIFVPRKRFSSAILTISCFYKFSSNFNFNIRDASSFILPSVAAHVSSMTFAVISPTLNLLITLYTTLF
jgi:hypothetical protein